MPYEVEQKYRVAEPASLIQTLESMGAVGGATERHEDTYFNHPSRDFAKTGEAFRIRRVNGTPMVTYKGPKLPGQIKARIEHEWRLDPGDPDGSKWSDLFLILGFMEVATVRKNRQPFFLSKDQPLVVLDEVEGLGSFAELELVLADDRDVEPARQRITSLGEQLGLPIDAAESRSYLVQVLQKAAS